MTDNPIDLASAVAELVKSAQPGKRPRSNRGRLSRAPMSVHGDDSLSVRSQDNRRGLQGLSGAHDGVVGTQGLARWMDVAMTRRLGRRMKPITVT
jgi:hypothetical protein